MYNITLFEEGRFCTDIGGALPTLPDAIDQIKAISTTLKAEELKDIFGYKFDRAGTTCAIVVTDSWHMPIKQRKEEE